MKKILLPLLSATLLITSCQKELQWNPEDSVINGSDSTGNSTNDSGTYMPTTANSKWTYKIHQTFKMDSTMFAGINLSALGITMEELMALMGMSQTAMDTSFNYDVTCTGRDTVMQSNTYRIFSSNILGSISESYQRKVNNEYYQRGTGMVTTADQQQVPTELEMLYLKTGLAVGTSWGNQTTLANGQTEDFKYTIINRGISKQVNGKVYNDVIQVQLKITPQVENLPPEFNFDMSTTTDYYYAKNIGFIYSEMKPSMGTSATTELISADIK